MRWNASNNHGRTRPQWSATEATEGGTVYSDGNGRYFWPQPRNVLVTTQGSKRLRARIVNKLEPGSDPTAPRCFAVFSTPEGECRVEVSELLRVDDCISNREAEELKPGGSLYLYSESTDEYFSEVDLLIEAYVEAALIGGTGFDDLSVVLCAEDPGNMPDADRIIEHACDEMYEEASSEISVEATAELEKFLAEWWQKNRPPGVVPGNVFVDITDELEEYLQQMGLSR